MTIRISYALVNCFYLTLGTRRESNFSYMSLLAGVHAGRALRAGIDLGGLRVVVGVVVTVVRPTG